MKKVRVSLHGGYDILIERGLFKEAGGYISEIFSGEKIMIITDSNVAELYLKPLVEILTASGFSVAHYILNAGEEYKTFGTVYDILRAMAEAGMTRNDLAITLGGGITGDLGGFAASIYMRGIRFIQMPTTLLADIDSSVGGKTGCDLPDGKNLAGSFYQPELVLIDPDLLKTLEPRYFNDGLAEAIKYGMIASNSLLQRLCDENPNDFLEALILECVDLKRRFVERDERESGDRKMLNFGHTLGHAIEKYYDYKKYSHGEAVAIGMAAISRAAESRALADIGVTEKLQKILEKYHLPVCCDAPMNRLADICKRDKKCRGNVIDLVLVKTPGKAFLHSICTDDLEEFFK